MKKQGFVQRLLGLISEPEFVKFENIFNEPNIFKIVGHTHYERWHSAFLGWLLDSNGSHLLSSYVLTRFLLLLFDEKCLKAINHNDFKFLSTLPTLALSNIEVRPNEQIPNETNVKGVGRFDVFLTAEYTDGENEHGKINIIFELKIDSKTNSEQSKKYADWIIENHPNDVNILIYILPNLLSSSAATIGDNRWYCIDYQLLDDKLLTPILDHPNLNEKVKPFIVQYIKNLKFTHNGVKMSITNEEKQLAIRLYEKYSDVFDAIFDALQTTNTIDYSTSDIPNKAGRASGKIAVKINNEVFSDVSVRNLFKNILAYLVNKKIILKLPLPWGIGKIRYIITNEKPPVHPSGRDFFSPVKHNDYSLETHYSRERAMKVLDDLCAKLGIDFELIEV